MAVVGGAHVIIHHADHPVTVAPAGPDKFQQDAAVMEAAERKQTCE